MKSFMPLMKTIYKKAFRVYAHIYYSHYTVVRGKGVDKVLNQHFRHFIRFVMEWDLIEEKELEPLQELITELVPSATSPTTSSTSSLNGLSSGSHSSDSPDHIHRHSPSVSLNPVAAIIATAPPATAVLASPASTPTPPPASPAATTPKDTAVASLQSQTVESKRGHSASNSGRHGSGSSNHAKKPSQDFGHPSSTGVPSFSPSPSSSHSSTDLATLAECPVCFEKFDDKLRQPRMLHCGHTLCVTDLNTLINKGIHAQCPECRQPLTTMTTLSAEQFPVNFIAIKLARSHMTGSHQHH